MEPGRSKFSFESLISGPLTRGKLILLISILLVAVAVAGVSFWVGISHNSDTQWILATKEESPQSPTPTPTDEPTDTPEPTPDITETPTRTPTPTRRYSPTPISTATPTNTPSPSPTPQSVTVPATATLDGYRGSDGGGDQTPIKVGRNSTYISRGLVSFSIPSAVSSSNLVSARIRMYQKDVTGTPYTTGGKIWMDHINFGDTISASAYNEATVYNGNYVDLSESANKEWKEVNVTEALRKDLTDSRTKTQYRLHFTTEATGGDATGDFAIFESAEAGNEFIPVIIISYR